MTTDKDAQAVATPGTKPAELARIAAQRPDLLPAIAAHKAAYPDLLAWLAALHDPAIDAALAARAASASRPGGNTRGTANAAMAPAPLPGRVPTAAPQPAQAWAEAPAKQAKPAPQLKLGGRVVRLTAPMLAGIVALTLIVIAGLGLGAWSITARGSSNADQAYFATKPHEAWSYKSRDGYFFHDLLALTDRGVLAYSMLNQGNGDRYELVGLDAKSGKERWKTELPVNHQCISDQRHRSQVFVCGPENASSGSSPILSVLNANSGKVTGRIHSPVISLDIERDAIFLVADVTGGVANVVGYRPDGREFSRVHLPVGSERPDITVTGSENSKLLAVTSDDASALVDRSSGRIAFQHEGGLTLDPTGVIFGLKASGSVTQSCRLTEKGKEEWCIEGTGPVVAGNVTALDQGNGTIAVDTSSGSVRWRSESRVGHTHVAGRTAFALAGDLLTATDMPTKKLLWSIPSDPEGSIVLDGTNVIALSRSGATAFRGTDGTQLWAGSPGLPGDVIKDLAIDEKSDQIIIWRAS